MERLRWESDRRRSVAHAAMPDTMYASTPNGPAVELSCPVPPRRDARRVLRSLTSADALPRSPLPSGDARAASDGGLVRSARLGGGYASFSGADGRVWSATPHDGWSTALAATAGSGATTHLVPMFPSASDPTLQGFARVVNHSSASGEVSIVAIDDAGMSYGPLTLSVDAGETAPFNSDDLENGNAAKGLTGGTGPGQGDWYLELSSELDLEVLSYIRTVDGFLTSMHDLVPVDGDVHRIAIFNPGSNDRQVSGLRLINRGTDEAAVTIAGVDDRGTSSDGTVMVTVPAGATRTLTAAELESGGTGMTGALGDGAGKWRLNVTSEGSIHAMSLLSSPTGHLTNLSTAPSLGDRDGAHRVSMFPPASDETLQGFVRVRNLGDAEARVTIRARDDTDWEYEPLTLTVGAGAVAPFNSDDLEQGNAGKGLAGSTGAGRGDWRLELSSDSDIEVLAYIRTTDGFLTAMHDAAPVDANVHRVAIFNPGSNDRQVSRLRIVNDGGEAASVSIKGIDDRGMSPGGAVRVTVPAGAAREHTAAELESGGAGLDGALGDGAGKWRLEVASDRPVRVLSLLSSPTGHLTNLSTATGRGGSAETPEEVFAALISPIVQSQCVTCHVEGGASGNTRLVFVTDDAADHLTTNFSVFETFVDEVDDAVEYILNKVQGVSHGGGVQLAAGTDGFSAMERFLGLLDGEDVGPVTITPATLFDGVGMESWRSTLRRAAIIFAGRIPTEEEYASIRGAKVTGFRAAIRNLMQGPGFHEFLLRGANDRLLTDRGNFSTGAIDAIHGYFVDFNNLNHSKRVAALRRFSDTWEDPAYRRWLSEVAHGVDRAPLELVAHVVENDLPYAEVLKADYIMANPATAEAYGADTQFSDPSNPREFIPSEIVSYYRRCDGHEMVHDLDTGTRVIDPGPCATDYPHAGILNTTVFLLRYPTTATNRNRARSRWTYYHFLGVDIEKSASRTTDPVALADTNNPTMHNAACTVCHGVLDPVAGAFQNYGEEGYYRDQWGGLDSLDEFYKANRGEAQAVEGDSYDERKTLRWRLLLSEGVNDVAIDFSNDFYDEQTGDDGFLYLDRVRVLDAEGNVVTHLEFEALGAPEASWGSCGETRDNPDGNGAHVALWNGGAPECTTWLEVGASVSDPYYVEVDAWADQFPNNADWAEWTAEMTVSVNPYREGDTWYRDMREAGFDGELVANADNSLPWLAERIVADPRFAEATVRFWWPAIMGAEVVEPPSEGDADFDGRLLASNAQTAEVARLAHGFRRGFHGGSEYNLKDLLTEIVLSRWFRADSVAGDDPRRAVAVAHAGASRLLTPEELSRKTVALTGFDWRRRKPEAWDGPGGVLNWTNTEWEYGLLYGGIDSDGITKRGRDLTSVMAGVAQRHASAASCPVVMKDLYLLPDVPKLLGGIDQSVTPSSEFGSVFEIEAASRDARETLTTSGSLAAGDVTVRLSFLNDFWDEASRDDRNVLADRLTVRRANGGDVVHTFEFEAGRYDDCGGVGSDHWNIWGECSIEASFTLAEDGRYDVEVVAWADQAGDEFARLGVFVETDTERAAGGRAIKSKLAELHQQFLGLAVDADSEDVRAAYGLFVDLWERRLKSGDDGDFWSVRCDWGSDAHYLDGIVDGAFVYRDDWDWGEGYDWDWDRINAHFDTIDWSDPHHVARTWVVVLAYLMTDPRYLHL